MNLLKVEDSLSGANGNSASDQSGTCFLRKLKHMPFVWTSPVNNNKSLTPWRRTSFPLSMKAQR